MEVQFDSVTKEFWGKSGCVTAVDRLSLSIGSGKLVGLLGPSGCGKSTSLFMLAGIYPLTSGRILFDGQDITSMTPEKRCVGMVFQNYALYPHLTVRQNIEFPLVNSKIMKHKLKAELDKKNAADGTKTSLKQLIAERARQAAHMVEIEDYLDRKPGELSGGQQQRVAIARAIVKQPSILLLDEPLSNLDARLRVQTREEIRKIQRKTGITTVFVTHDQEEALNICDEIAIIKNGVLQQYGMPQEVYDRPANQFVAEFLGGTKINILPGEVTRGVLTVGGVAIREPVDCADGPVTVGIRPENIISSTPQEGKGLTAIVIRLTRLGGATNIEAALPNGEIFRLMKENGSQIKIGDAIGLILLPNAVCLFGNGGEKLWQG